MIFEVKVASKADSDPRGQDLLTEIKRTLKISSIAKIRTAKVYRLEGLSKQQAQKFANLALVENIDQTSTINGQLFKDAAQLVEIAYKPGVMNPESLSILKIADDLGIKLEAADSSTLYAFYGNVRSSQLSTIIRRLLVNPTVEHVVTKSPKTLIISGKAGKVQTIPIRKLSDNGLLSLSRNKLFLNLEEMKVIQRYFKKVGRDPTDCEIETLALTWSEHCGHKTFKAKLVIDGKVKEPLITRIKKTAKNNAKIIVSAFDDNSGVIDFYDGFAINGKVETHNSPSAIEPYGGAMTGSGGVFRDILGTGQGAKPIASTDIFCFAPSDLESAEIPPGCLPPDYLLRHVVAGVRDYGNRVGIPTNNGSIHFHKDFRAKPTVAVGSFGILPKKFAKKGNPEVGDLILTIGGATGRDGIHGATFASGEMTHRTGKVLGSAVQIGNAIEEKRIIDVVFALRQENLIRAITDCGAGGYASAIGEIAAKIGAHVYLEKVPLKYAGLAPWEIFLSESQERMILAISPKNKTQVLKICKIYNVPAHVIGKFTGTKKLAITYGSEKVCGLEMSFLHEGLPQRTMIGKTHSRHSGDKRSEDTRIDSGQSPSALLRASQNDMKLPSKNINLQRAWLDIMAHPNVASKEPIIRMYDHNVQGTSALHPLSGVDLDAPNDGAIMRPILNKPYGVAITHGLNPAANLIDPYAGSIWAITEAVSNYVAVGGQIENAALIDNFIWPFPDEESLADLDKSVDACVQMANLLGMPFVSGKDSLSSTYRYPEGPERNRRTTGKVLKIPPVLLISVFGKIPNVAKTASSDFKKVGSTIVLVGKPDFTNMGASIYFEVVNATSAKVPNIDLKNLKKVFSRVTSGIKSGQILSAHDISEGGLAATLAEMCFGAGFGAEIDLSSVAKAKEDRPDYILFNETPGTFLVEVEKENVAKKLFANVPHSIIGKTVSDSSIRVDQESKNLCKSSLSELKEAWQKPMKEIFH